MKTIGTPRFWTWCAFVFVHTAGAYGQDLFDPPITILDNRSSSWQISVSQTDQTFAVSGEGKIFVFYDQRSIVFFRNASVVALSHNGQKVAMITHLGGTESWEKGLMIWDLQTDFMDSVNVGFLVHESIEFSPDASRLSLITQNIDFRNDQLYLFDLAQMKQIATLQIATGYSTSKATFSPDWHWLVVSRVFDGGPLDGIPEPGVVLWDMTTLQEYRPLFGNIGLRSCCGGSKVVFTPDGHQIITQDAFVIRTYDILSGQELEVFDTGKAVGDATLSPNGNYLATFSRDGVPADYATRVWDWKARKLIGTVVNETPGIFSPDESLLAFVGKTGEVRIWSVTERRELAPLTGLEASISDMAFTPDGTALVTADIFGLVQLWKRYLPTSVVGATGQVLPEHTYLGTAYPNPANPQVWIPYGLAKESEVTISIFNIAGQLMDRLELGNRPAGYYTGHSAAYWDGRDSIGRPVSSGVYIVVLESETVTATGKLVLLK